jgi:hypothetical protein
VTRGGACNRTSSFRRALSLGVLAVAIMPAISFPADGQSYKYFRLGNPEDAHTNPVRGYGDGFVAIPVREFRGSLVRPFESKGIEVGLNFLIARGYGGQTLETLALPGETVPFERITGYPLKSYVTASLTYHFRRR